MVIDTSTGFTMLNDESEADRFEAAIEAEPGRLMSTATCLEISIVIEG
ncbi:type II toxin-antitoxin system VapC family toxin [Nocardia sp. NPDC050630]